MKAKRCTGPTALGGFTLLEVLVAVVVLSLAIAVLMSGLGGATRLVGVSDQHEIAVDLAQSKLEEYLQQRGNALAAEVDDLVYDGVKYGFKIESTPLAGVAQEGAARVASQWVLHRIRVEVYWGDAPHLHHYALTTYQRRKGGG